VQTSSVAVIVIAWNEADALRRVLPEVQLDSVTELIVVDGGSIDGTPEVAAALGARVVRQHGRGYGDACLSGALATDADILVFLDGDYADDPREIPRVLAPILGGQAELAIGTRDGPDTEPGALPRHQRAGNWVALALMRLIYGVQLRDLGSLRAVRREHLFALGMREMTYGWPVEMVVKSARRGYRVVGVPVRYRRRIGSSKVGGTLRGSLLAGYRMFAVLLRHAVTRSAMRSAPRNSIADR
jgi:glycosyltransferase involved in cell wall biosynthesis